MKGYVDAQIVTTNGNIITANTAMKGYVDAQIVTVNSSITTANTAMKSYSDYQDGLITTAWTANAAVQSIALNSLATGANANTAAYLTTAIGNIKASSFITTSGVYWANGAAYTSPITSTGAGNITIAGSAINLTSSGPGATTTGSSTAIPIITTDVYGRVSTLTTAVVVAPAGTLSGSTLAAGVTASSLTSVGTLTGLTVTAPIAGSVTGTAASITGTYGGSLTSGQVTTGLGFTPYNATNPNGYQTTSGSVASATTAGTVTTAAQPAITSVGTLTSLAVSGATTLGSTLAASVNNTINIGAVGTTFATVYATTFSGVSTTAKYADLAENYEADVSYAPGTVLMFGGSNEVTVASLDTTRVAGVVSTNPAHLMNSSLQGDNVVAVALQGRVPCRVIGPVEKGDMLVSAGDGYAKVNNTPLSGQVIGKAVGEYAGSDRIIIEIVVGRL